MAKEIILRFSDEEYAMIQRVAGRRKRSIRSLLLWICRQLDYEDEKKGRKRK